MAEHPNVAVVRNAYESFAKGDLDGALADLADDCVFHFGGDGPNSGDHKGREAITAALIEVHILRLRDGKVVDLWDLPEDIQAHDDFFDGK